MKKIVETVPYDKIKDFDMTIPYFGDRKVCMFDIETTGLSPLKSFTYLIGINVFKDGEWQIIQLFNDDGRSEPEMIRCLHEILSRMDVLVEFNGDTFDIPYIQKRMSLIESKYHISLTDNFDKVESFDLLKIMRPYKISLGLPNLKQKTIEKYIGLDRVDMYNGGELINVYLKFLTDGNSKSEGLVLRHNRDDMEGMLYISSVLSLEMLCRGEFEITAIGTFKREGADRLRLKIEFTTAYKMVRDICAVKDFFELDIDGKSGVLSVPIYDTELGYYYGRTEKEGSERVKGFFVKGPAEGTPRLMNYREKARDKEYYIMLSDDFLGEQSVLKDFATKIISEIMHFRGRK